MTFSPPETTHFHPKRVFSEGKRSFSDLAKSCSYWFCKGSSSSALHRIDFCRLNICGCIPLPFHDFSFFLILLWCLRSSIPFLSQLHSTYVLGKICCMCVGYWFCQESHLVPSALCHDYRHSMLPPPALRPMSHS